jgi:hypothetical protein
MKTYKVFVSGNQSVAIKQGWSWPAFFFQWIWAFTKGLIPIGVLFLILNLLFALIPVKNAANPYLLIAGIVFGLKANKWWAAKLLKAGFSEKATVQASNPNEAISKATSSGFPFVEGKNEAAGSRHPNAPEQRPGSFN